MMAVTIGVHGIGAESGLLPRSGETGAPLHPRRAVARSLFATSGGRCRAARSDPLDRVGAGIRRAGPTPRSPLPKSARWSPTSALRTSTAGRARSTATRTGRPFVVAFVDTECPVANLYIPALIDLHKAYAARGVQFLAINSSSQDSFASVSAHAQERGVPFPVLKDFDQSVADAFGAERTPEVFLLDAGRHDPLPRPHRRPVRHRLPPRQADAGRPQGGPRRAAGGPADRNAADRRSRAARSNVRGTPHERARSDLRQAGLADHPVLDARNATVRARSGRSRS